MKKNIDIIDESSSESLIPSMFVNKIKIPWDLIDSKYKRDKTPLHKLGEYLKAALDIDDDVQIDVSKICISDDTEVQLDKIMSNYLKKTYSAMGTKKTLSYIKLLSYPSNDYNNEYNLQYGYVYVKDNYIIEGK